MNAREKLEQAAREFALVDGESKARNYQLMVEHIQQHQARVRLLRVVLDMDVNLIEVAMDAVLMALKTRENKR